MRSTSARRRATLRPRSGIPAVRLDATDNVYAGCYEDEYGNGTDGPNGLMDAFNEGEQIFERSVTISTAPFKGLGPASTRRSCLDRHPSYGHGKRSDTYTTAEAVTKYGSRSLTLAIRN